MSDFKELFLASFHVLLLTALFCGLLAFTLHMAHHDMDKELISWGRESAATVLGGLMYALTKRDPKNGDSPK